MNSKLAVLLVILICVFSTISHAEDYHIKNIRKLYNHLKKTESNFQKHVVTLNVVYPAIGLQKTKITFIHSSKQVNPQRDPYQMKFILKKVIVAYNISAHATFYMEYLYDQSQSPCFFYTKQKGIESGEKRLYFHKNRLITIIRKHKTAKSHLLSYTSGMRFKLSDIKYSKVILKKMFRYRDMFKELVKMEKLK